MNAAPFATGGCRCGTILITIRNKPQFMAQCHCLDCQKESGTGHTSNAYFAEDDVVIDGKATGHSVIADSGDEMTRYFCPACGSRLFGRNSGRPGLISVQVGCLDDCSWFKPQVVLYTSRKYDWDITSDGIPGYEKMPPPES